jgi:hypothetical protein
MSIINDACPLLSYPTYPASLQGTCPASHVFSIPTYGSSHQTHLAGIDTPSSAHPSFISVISEPASTTIPAKDSLQLPEIIVKNEATLSSGAILCAVTVRTKPDSSGEVETFAALLLHSEEEDEGHAGPPSVVDIRPSPYQIVDNSRICIILFHTHLPLALYEGHLPSGIASGFGGKITISEGKIVSTFDFPRECCSIQVDKFDYVKLALEVFEYYIDSHNIWLAIKSLADFYAVVSGREHPVAIRRER